MALYELHQCWLARARLPGYPIHSIRRLEPPHKVDLAIVIEYPFECVFMGLCDIRMTFFDLFEVQCLQYAHHLAWTLRLINEFAQLTCKLRECSVFSIWYTTLLSKFCNLRRHGVKLRVGIVSKRFGKDSKVLDCRRRCRLILTIYYQMENETGYEPKYLKSMFKWEQMASRIFTRRFSRFSISCLLRIVLKDFNADCDNWFFWLFGLKPCKMAIKSSVSLWHPLTNAMSFSSLEHFGPFSIDFRVVWRRAILISNSVFSLSKPPLQSFRVNDISCPPASRNWTMLPASPMSASASAMVMVCYAQVATQDESKSSKSYGVLPLRWKK